MLPIQFGVAVQRVPIQDRQSAVVRLQDAGPGQCHQRGIAALPGNAAQAGDLFLRYLQAAIGAGMRFGVQLRRDGARNSGVDIQQHIARVGGHQPVDTLGQVRHQRLGELDIVVPLSLIHI